MDAGFDHGSPIKLLVGEQPVYVCCADLVEPIRRNPGFFLAKLPAASTAAEGRPAVHVEFAPDAEYAAVQAQGFCPVMNVRLGTHGHPLKVTIDGQTLFVCCQGCVRRVQENPGQYLAAIQRRP